MNWKDQKILVTGAGGFIGSHLVETLVQYEATVRAFVHYNSRGDPGLLSQTPRELLDKIQISYGDLRDASAVRQAVEGVSSVFHLGAVISIPYSYRHPNEVAETNIIGTLNVLQACRDLGVDRLIHTSSSEVYGTAQRVPIDESHSLQGQSPYSASKIGADKLVESYNLSYGLPVVTVRPFNTYGPRQSARAVIPTIIAQALTTGEIILGNLAPKRDLTYILDTVDGFLKAGQTPGIEGEVFNLGSGSEISIAELADLIIELVGREARISVAENRMRPAKSEVQRLLADNSKALGCLDWMPQVSLADGLSRTIDWIADHIQLYDAENYQV